MVTKNHSRAKKASDLKRRQAKRQSVPRILIVSEGNTEAFYLEEIRQHSRLSKDLIVIHPCIKGTAPKQVVDYGYTLFMKGNPHLGIEKKDFDQVYFLFDRDEHPSFYEALEYAEDLHDKKLINIEGEIVSFKAIVSVPSFELWLLLHYIKIQNIINRADVMKQLKKRFPKYDKGIKGLFKDTKPLLNTAISNAKLLTETNSPHDGKVPYTNLGELVEVLISSKDRY